MKVLYIDVVWLINFVMDIFILILAAWMARKKIRPWRIVLGAILGASYALLLFVPGITGPTMSFVTKTLFSCFMVAITFRPVNVIEFLRILGFFYLASFVIGGAAYGFNSLMADTHVLGGMVLISGGTLWNLNYKILGLLIAVFFVYLVGKYTWKRLNRYKNREENLWRVRMEMEDIMVELMGLLDTGNGLKDPISGLPVAVVEWQALEPILPQSLIDSYKRNRDITIELSNMDLSAEWHSRLRIIPYRGVGGTVGMLLAFRPDKFVIWQGEKEFQVPGILVAVNPKTLSNENLYQAILPQECLLS